MGTALAARGSAAPRTGVAAERYDGWLAVERTAARGFDSYRTETAVDFGGGWAELVRLSWSQPVESTWRTSERCYLLSIVLDGPAAADRRAFVSDQTRPCSGRRVRLVAPGQTVHSVGASCGDLRSMRCFIDAAVVESICATRPTDEERAQIGAVDLTGGTIEWLLVRMYREISTAGTGMAIAVDSIAREIAVEIARAIERRRFDARRSAGGLPAWRMRLVIDRVYAEGRMPKIADLADICGMTVRHLGRAFYAETGRTIGKFIAAAMAERASRMLTAGIPVNVVALTLGYATSSSFAHAFFRETGLLPSAIRDAGGLRAAA